MSNIDFTPGGVGCIAWLGLFAIIPLWQFCIVWAGCLFVFGQCVRILVEEYGEQKKHRCKDEQCPSEPNNPATLFVRGGADDSEQAGKLVKRLHRDARVESRIGRRTTDKLLHLGDKLLSGFFEIVRRLRAHRPNENSTPNICL